ncbi:hypothetical protein CcCBS67573_g04536 [Chytriomyces confervae]|uniref:Uncharacterized protein n=1 Tax=Chytriomyces confervae TaxID=246404 RepID=A0A507FDA0_9FUNG|nr:hypothetical protein HDU80_005492 [Chytriomyces hyalinus]TPX74194.1 hypothetical protein CcCBS67573_g04536 [Chytriomyces confervae]
MEDVTAALSHARQAVSLDNSGQTLQALRAYGRSVRGLDAVLFESDSAIMDDETGADAEDRLSEAERTKLIALRSAYVKRVEALAGGSAQAFACYSGALTVNSTSSQSQQTQTATLPPSQALFNAVFINTIDVPDTRPDARFTMAPHLPPTSNVQPASLACAHGIHSLASRMRVIAQTISTGAFVSPRLIVVNQVWVQPPGIRLVAVDQKSNVLDSIAAMLRDMPSNTPLNSRIAQAKEGIDTILMNPQIMLLKRLAGEISNSFETQFMPTGLVSSNTGAGGANIAGSAAGGKGWLPSFKGLNPLASSAPKGDKVGDLSIYVDLIASSFKTISSGLDTWTATLSGNPQEFSRSDSLLKDLQYVVKFLETVVLAFVVRDVERLMERYIRMVSAAALEV